VLAFTHFVIPAKAGIQLPPVRALNARELDSRLRGNDEIGFVVEALTV
jgi:hypothetical protein